jgi:hypothetical protein
VASEIANLEAKDLETYAHISGVLTTHTFPSHIFLQAVAVWLYAHHLSAFLSNELPVFQWA